MMKYANMFARRLGGYRKVWRARFKPGPHPTKVVLLPGEYVHPDGSIQPLGLLFSHFSPVTRKSTVCSSTWGLEGDVYVNTGKTKCVGCKTIENKRAGQKAPELSMTMKYLATALILEDYHLSPFGYDGKTPLGLDNKGNQKYSKVLCTGDADCEGCKRGWKKVYGRRMAWEIPPTYAEKMRAVLEGYSDTCGNCGSDGLEIVGAVCPQCGHDYPFHVSEGEPVTCPNCGQVDVPVIDYSCPHCDDPKPVDLFSGVWQVTTVASKNGKWQELVVSRFYPGPIKPKALKRLEKDHGENWKKLLEPLDMERLYQPEPLGVQAQILGVANPYLKEEVTSMEKQLADQAKGKNDDDGYDEPF